MPIPYQTSTFLNFAQDLVHRRAFHRKPRHNIVRNSLFPTFDIVSNPAATSLTVVVEATKKFHAGGRLVINTGEQHPVLIDCDSLTFFVKTPKGVYGSCYLLDGWALVKVYPGIKNPIAEALLFVSIVAHRYLAHEKKALPKQIIKNYPVPIKTPPKSLK